MHARVARHLEQDLSEAEQARRQAVLRRAQPQFGVHRKRGVTDICAIELVRDVHHDHQGAEPLRDAFISRSEIAVLGRLVAMSSLQIKRFADMRDQFSSENRVPTINEKY
jgi:hypothetical protein